MTFRGGPLKFSVPVSQAYTSVSFYTRTDVAYYAINDRAAGRRVIELDLMTTDQRNDLPGERGDHGGRPADRGIRRRLTGLIVIKALAPEPGLLPSRAQRARRRACQSQRAELELASARRPLTIDAIRPRASAGGLAMLADPV